MALRKPNYGLKLYEENFPEVFSGAGFSLNDDEWDLYFRETRAIHKGLSKFKFENIPSWIKPKIKEFMAEAWLKKNYSNSHLSKLKVALDTFVEFLVKETNVVSINSLEQHIALQYEDYLNKLNGKAGSSKAKAFEVIRLFSEFLYKNYESEIGEDFYFKGVIFAKQKRETPYVKAPKDIPIEICLKVMAALKIEEQEIESILHKGDNKNNAINNAKNRYVYCQVLKLILASGRRASHILHLSKECVQILCHRQSANQLQNAFGIR